MVTCQADSSVTRVSLGDFHFPLGAYPIEEMTPKAGYSLHFEPSDGGDDEGDWEEWPDRYVFDIVVSAERVEPLCRLLFAQFPGRVYPILDVMGHDAYREIDPYIAYELVGTDRFTDALRRFRDFFYEDGMCGFGAMSEEPFLYVFVDEHKIVTVRAEPTMKERLEKILQAFDLEQTENPAGADAAAHEHRNVLIMPKDRPELLGPEEIIERLRDDWQLLLNVDPDGNVDDAGKDIGTTLWRVVVRCEYEETPSKYAEFVLYAKSLREAENTALDEAETVTEGDDPACQDLVVVASDRLTAEQLKEYPGKLKKVKPGAQDLAGTVIGSMFLT